MLRVRDSTEFGHLCRVAIYVHVHVFRPLAGELLLSASGWADFALKGECGCVACGLRRLSPQPGG